MLEFQFVHHQGILFLKALLFCQKLHLMHHQWLYLVFYIFQDFEHLKIANVLLKLIKVNSRMTEEQKARLDNLYVTPISNSKVDGKPIGGLGDAEATWHSDMTYVEVSHSLPCLWFLPQVSLALLKLPCLRAG